MDEEEERTEVWTLGMSTCRDQAKEAGPEKETEKVGVVRQEENQQSVVSLKPSEESVPRRRMWSTLSDAIKQ